MKQIHLFIIGLLAYVALLTGCQQFDNLDSQDGLVSSSIQIYWQNDTSRTYRITYNNREVVMPFNPGKTVSNSLNFTHLPSDTVGVINIYNGAATTPEFSGTVNVNKQVQFIQMYNDPIMIYNKADITNFYISIVYQATSGNTYTATFNDAAISLVPYTRLMISRSKLTGTLKLYKNGSTTPVYSGSMTIVPEKTLSLVQLPNKEIGPIDDAGEANPSTKNSTKIRFAGAKEIGANGVRVDFYTAPYATSYYMYGDYSGYKFFKSITIKAGELTPYIEFNLAQYGSTDPEMERLIVAFDIYDAQTGVLIQPKGDELGGLQIEKKEDDRFSPIYKFATMQFAMMIGYGYYDGGNLFGTTW